MFKNKAAFSPSIAKISNMLIDNAKELTIVLQMYSYNCSMTLGSLWNYCRDEIEDIDDNASQGKSFKHNNVKYI